MSKKRKILGTIGFIVLITIVYFVWQNIVSKKVQTTYTLAKVTRGSLIKTVSGSGQVSASNQLDISPKASGEIIKLNIVKGQEVKNGDILAQLDAADIYKSLRDAEANLASAKLAMQKLQQPTDQLSLLQAQNYLTAAQESKQQAEDNLAKAYEDGFNNVANAFLDLPGVMSGLRDILFGNDINVNQDNIDYYLDNTKYYDESAKQYHDDADNTYQQARSLYDANFNTYKSLSRFSDTATIESLIEQTYNTTKNIAEAVKSANNLIQFYQDKLIERNIEPSPIAITHLNSLDGYTGTTNSHLLSLLGATNSLQTDKNSIISVQRSIDEKQESLAKLKAGTDVLDLRSQELAVQQKQNAWADLREKLADYTIRAPFDGVIADVGAKKGDTASTATVLATLITKQSIAEISLNEVDAAQVQVGQKVTLTFDAVESLSISGLVAELDTLGTVSQGVVTYNVKLAFDTQDERVKPGMTVSASIITTFKPDVLLVDNVALKSTGDSYYVEMPNEIIAEDLLNSSSSVLLKNSLRQQSVEIGLSDDSVTEISSGLVEGDIFIKTSTVSSQTSQNSANGRSILQTTGTASDRPQGGFIPR